jgi:isopentenyl diphosphate isomerase/L-lactate dehydrogenase-like FMN-dependent dehydrogenase
MMLMAEEILGQPVVEFGYADKYFAHEVVRKLSSLEQKVSAGTYGAIVQLPFAIGTMTGI